MKSSRIFFGLFFLTLGFVLLFDNVFPGLPFHDIWKLWPLILLLLGISSIVQINGIKKIVIALTAIIAAVIISNGIFNVGDVHTNFSVDFDDEIEEFQSGIIRDTISIPYDSTLSEQAYLTISSGASNCMIKGISEQALFFNERSANTTSNNDTINGGNIDKHDYLGEYSINHEIRENKNYINVDMGGNINLFNNVSAHSSLIKLHPQALWNITLEGGASSIEADLSEYRVQKLDVEVGASAVKVKVGAKYPNTIITFSGGAASAEFSIPEESGCRIISKSGLSANHFSGFTSRSKNIHETPNFSSTKNKIFMTIESGISSITVNRHTDKSPEPHIEIDSSHKEKKLYKRDIKPTKNSVRT